MNQTMKNNLCIVGYLAKGFLQKQRWQNESWFCVFKLDNI
jgi:hypothetical protein